MKKTFFAIAMTVALTSLALSGCGSSGGSGTTSAGLNNAQTVSGTISAPNGDVISGATIYIPSGSASVIPGEKVVRTKFYKLTAGDGSTCDDPEVTTCASTCSSADGTFSMDSSACTGSESEMIAKKGALQTTVSLNCTSDPCTANADFSGSGTSVPKVAVVTGLYDSMQNVLAKIFPGSSGYGTVDENGILQPGSESSNLVLIDGDNSLDSSYDDFDVYLNGTKSFDDFDVVFINCGNSHEALLSSGDVLTRIQNYVNNGGRWYVTDLSYDFVNQAFPSFMNFEGDTDANTPGAIGSAETGTAFITVDAAVNDTPMTNWLQNVTVIQQDSNTPGNPDNDCNLVDPTAYTTRTSALTSGGTIPLGDFLGGWARMIGQYDTGTFIWISSGAGVIFDGLANRPLTVSADQGSGKIFYTSYHTANECPTPYFWPQERVLQYLIFEAL